MIKSTTQMTLVFLAIMTLALAGCSDGDNVESAKKQVEQAKQELAQAKSELADAKDDTGQDKTGSAEQQASDNKTRGADDVAQAAPEPTEEPPASASSQEQVCANCGTISTIAPVTRQNGPPEFVGTILGGVAGAAVGHQIGSGSGNTIATIVGAVGGALAGHEAQQRITGKRFYKVNVRMDAGGTRTVTVPSAKRINEGMRVRVRDGNIVLM